MLIKSFGFEKIGEWRLDNSENKITFKLEKFEKERVIYAFVVDREVKYIGVCNGNNTTLKDRMNRYKYKQGGSTNKRINNEIKRYLLKKKAS